MVVRDRPYPHGRLRADASSDLLGQLMDVLGQIVDLLSELGVLRQKFIHTLCLLVVPPRQHVAPGSGAVLTHHDDWRLQAGQAG